MVNRYADFLINKVVCGIDEYIMDLDKEIDVSLENFSSGSGVYQRDEIARSLKGDLYFQMLEIRQLAIGMTVAALYHYMERLLIGFLTRELREWGITEKDIRRKFSGFDKMVSSLSKMNYNMSAFDWYSFIERANHISNITKHGNGNSLEKAYGRFPEIFYADDESIENENYHADSDFLLIESHHLEETREAVILFFRHIPALRVDLI